MERSDICRICKLVEIIATTPVKGSNSKENTMKKLGMDHYLAMLLDQAEDLSHSPKFGEVEGLEGAGFTTCPYKAMYFGLIVEVTEYGYFYI